MKAINGTTPVHTITLPGTHNSGAKEDGASFGFAMCQSKSITKQLEEGVRYLDIRCRLIGDTFTIHHGQVYQKISFGDVLAMCRDFLKNMTSEAIVMKISTEHTSEPSSPDITFEKVWSKFYDANKDIFYQGTSEKPILQEVRGRIFVISDDCHKGVTVTEGKLKIQDKYECSSAKEKVSEIQKFYANVNLDLGFHLNHCSGYVKPSCCSFFRTRNPYAMSLATNKLVFTFKKTCGIVAMDFPTTGQIDALIALNKTS
jgi:1-phosphatidylinositol phosphodiesterase